MPDLTSCCRVHGGYCQRCDVLVGLVGLHVIGVERDDTGLRVWSSPGLREWWVVRSVEWWPMGMAGRPWS
jgi:hypothetical protein